VKKWKNKEENAVQAKRRRKSISTNKIDQSARKAEIARKKNALKTGEARTEEKGEKEEKEEERGDKGEKDTITMNVATAKIDTVKIVIVRERKRKSAVSAAVQERKSIEESNDLVPGTRIIDEITDSMWQTTFTIIN
jgi:hypothetical protein